MGYFERSQGVRQELLSEDGLLTQAKRAFNSEYEEFGAGKNASLFRIGTLPSGLYVAIRVPRGWNSLSLLEDYCQNAEMLDSEGKEVPKFCVGVLYGERAGIFTEDLTKGDTQSFEHCPDEEFVWVGSGKHRRKVYVDIDHLFKWRRHKELKYFLDDHLIKL